MAQMLSLDVDRVSDLRIGERPKRMEEMSAADLIVASRRWDRLGSGGVGGACAMCIFDRPGRLKWLNDGDGGDIGDV